MPGIASYSHARDNMVLGQLLPGMVTAKSILKIMSKIPREEFVPPSLSYLSYADKAVEISENRYLLAPMVLGRLLQEAELTKKDKVLDIGFGTGYSTILLSFLTHRVVGLESDQTLVERLKSTLLEYEISNVLPVYGLLLEGCTKEALYDVIFIQGAVHTIPSSLKAQVSEGGRIVTMQKKNLYGPSYGVIMSKNAGVWTERHFFTAATPCLKEFEKEKEFSL